MREKKMKVQRQVKEEFDLLGLLVRWARVVLQISIFLLVVSLGYILYGIFSGVLNHQVDPRVVGNLRLMGQILALASTAGALAFCFLTIDELAYAVVAGIVGAGLMFGVPMLVANNLAQGDTRAIAVINEWSKNGGMGVLAVVALRVLFEIVQQIRMAEEKRRIRAELEGELGPKKAKRVASGVWSPCWGLPYCHEAVREHCPAYKARKSCWRFGYGCNCDPSLIERLIRSGAMESGRGAQYASSQQKTTHEAYVRSDLQADLIQRQKERTIPCSKCPIYLDHQRQKFKIVNPIGVIAALAAMAALYKPLTGIYTLVVTGTAHMASRLTYGSNVDAGSWFTYLNTSGLKIFFFIIVALLVLAYVLKFVEWLVFEKKL